MTNYAMGVYLAMAEGQPVKAIPFFEKAVEEYPIFAHAHFYLGNCYIKKFDLKKAVDSYRAAIRYSSTTGEVAQMARKGLRDLEDTVTASTDFKTIDAYIENKMLFDQAFQALTEKRYDECIERFILVLKQDPKHVQSYGNLALAYAALGKKELALKGFDKALEIDPDYEPAIFNRIMIENMKEGVPHAPIKIKETEYYAYRFGGKSYAKELIEDFAQMTKEQKPNTPGLMTGHRSTWLEKLRLCKNA